MEQWRRAPDAEHALSSSVPRASWPEECSTRKSSSVAAASNTHTASRRTRITKLAHSTRQANPSKSRIRTRWASRRFFASRRLTMSPTSAPLPINGSSLIPWLIEKDCRMASMFRSLGSVGTCPIGWAFKDGTGWRMRMKLARLRYDFRSSLSKLWKIFRVSFASSLVKTPYSQAYFRPCSARQFWTPSSDVFSPTATFASTKTPPR